MIKNSRLKGLPCIHQLCIRDKTFLFKVLLKGVLGCVFRQIKNDESFQALVNSMVGLYLDIKLIENRERRESEVVKKESCTLSCSLVFTACILYLLIMLYSFY